MKANALVDFPTNNPLVLLNSDPSKLSSIKVKGEADGQETDYSVSFSRDKVIISGQYAGEAIDIVGERSSPDSFTFKSQSGTPVDVTLSASGMGFDEEGKVDGKEFKQHVEIDPFALIFGGDFLKIAGQIAGNQFAIGMQVVSDTVAQLKGEVDSQEAKVDVTTTKLNLDGSPAVIQTDGSYADVKVKQELKLEYLAAQQGEKAA